MSNVLKTDTQQQVLALGRLGWSLREIEQATGVRRETASAYLRGAHVPVRGRGGHPRVWPPPNPATMTEVVTTGSGPAPPPPERVPSASACEPFRELITAALTQGRNAVAIWQDLVDAHGFTARYTSVRRFVATAPASVADARRSSRLATPGAPGTSRRRCRRPRGAECRRASPRFLGEEHRR